ncbi:hypothetical protein [Haliea sp.]
MAEVAVIGIPNEPLGEALMALVVLKPDPACSRVISPSRDQKQ